MRLPTTNLFDTLAGLPTHPLVVHLAVVMLPLATLGLLAIIIVPAWRASHGWLTMAGLGVGAVGAVLATQTGEALAGRLGVPQDHARWGDLLEKSALALLTVAIIWFVLQRRTAAQSPRSAVLGPPPQATAAVLSIVMAIGVLALTVVVGHSGAAAVWQGRVTAAASSNDAPTHDSPSLTSTTSSRPAAAASAFPTASVTSGSITMAEVQHHATASRCWSVVDGGVYDLTTWISLHPGGPTVIKAMCGTDASVAFHNQHGTQGEPNADLAKLQIGALAQ